MDQFLFQLLFISTPLCLSSRLCVCGLNSLVKTANLRKPLFSFSPHTLLLFPHQIFEEGRDLSGEHSQVEEPCGDLVVVLGKVAVPQVLQYLNILLLVVYMG